MYKRQSQYRALFLDDTIAPILLEKLAENAKEGYVTWLMSQDVYKRQVVQIPLINPPITGAEI